MEMGCQKRQLILASILTVTSEWREERKESDSTEERFSGQVAKKIYQ